MAKSEIGVEISVETVIHKAFHTLAKTTYDKYGIVVDSVHFNHKFVEEMGVSPARIQTSMKINSRYIPEGQL